MTARIYCSAVCRIQTICLQCVNNQKCMPIVQSALSVNIPVNGHSIDIADKAKGMTYICLVFIIVDGS